MSNPSISVAGVFPPIATPFTAAGDVDFTQLANNFEQWNAQPLNGYVIQGSNGEVVYLTPDERVELVGRARALAPADRLIIAGSAMESTRDTIALTKRMAEAGADIALVATPSFFPKHLTPAVLENHYRRIADEAPLPVMLYSVPANTGVDLPAEVVIRLASHPNIIGLKDSGGNVTKIGYMVYETPDAFQVLAGSAGFLLGAMSVGAVGGVMALANIAATPLAELVGHIQQGNLAEARRVQGPLIEPNTAITARFGVPGLKSAMDMVGLYGGPVRAPLLPLGEADQQTLSEILVKAGLL